jgi:hypothetical protein
MGNRYLIVIHDSDDDDRANDGKPSPLSTVCDFSARRLCPLLRRRVRREPDRVLEEERLLIRPLNIFFFLVDVVGQHATAAMDFWKKRGRQDAGGSTKPGSSKRQRALADSSWTEDSEVFAAAGSRYHKNAVSAGGATKAAGGARKAAGGSRKA